MDTTGYVLRFEIWNFSCSENLVISCTNSLPYRVEFLEESNPYFMTITVTLLQKDVSDVLNNFFNISEIVSDSYLYKII